MQQNNKNCEREEWPKKQSKYNNKKNGYTKKDENFCREMKRTVKAAENAKNKEENTYNLDAVCDTTIYFQ